MYIRGGAVWSGDDIPSRLGISLVKTPVRTVRIPDPMWDSLRDRSKELGTDASAVIRGLVSKWLEGTPLPESKDHDRP